jgi:hypothetical protein
MNLGHFALPGRRWRRVIVASFLLEGCGDGIGSDQAERDVGSATPADAVAVADRPSLDAEAGEAGAPDADGAIARPDLPTPGEWNTSPETPGFPDFRLDLEDVHVRNGRPVIGRLSVVIDAWSSTVLAGTNVPLEADGSWAVSMSGSTGPYGDVTAALDGRFLAPGFVCGEVRAHVAGLFDGTSRFGGRPRADPYGRATTCDQVACGGEPWAERLCLAKCGACGPHEYCDARRVVGGESLERVCWPGDECGDGPPLCPEGFSCGVYQTTTVCVPAGTGERGDACRVDPHAAAAPCRAGHTCVGGVCERPCLGEERACPEAEVCVRSELTDGRVAHCLGLCDPLRGADCAEGQACRLVRVSDVVAATCRPSAGVLEPGLPCDPEVDRCAAGFVCSTSRGLNEPVCHRICDRLDEAGCAAHEVCLEPPSLENARWGICRAACDPVGPETCPGGAVCGTVSCRLAEGGLGTVGQGLCVPRDHTLSLGMGCSETWGELCGPGLVCAAAPRVRIPGGPLPTCHRLCDPTRPDIAPCPSDSRCVMAGVTPYCAKR